MSRNNWRAASGWARRMRRESELPIKRDVKSPATTVPRKPAPIELPTSPTLGMWVPKDQAQRKLDRLFFSRPAPPDDACSSSLGVVRGGLRPKY